MTQDPPLSIIIEVTEERRFRWSISDGRLVCLREEASYATRREAQAAGVKAMGRMLQPKK